MAAATTLAGLGFAASAPPAFAGPVAGSPWVVSVGDSAISGEAGRWAGNTNGSSSTVDALGSTAYYDNASNTAELIPGCHRSKSAEIYLGGGVSGTNLACSGARTGTAPYASGSDFKPGLDFYDDGAGHQGQALLLQQFAATHNVQAVTVMIGANNFNFASILQTCVQDFLLSPSWWPNYCYDDSSVSKNFTSTNVAAQTTAIATAVGNTHRAMANAGYTDADYTIVVQTYWDPIPYGSQFRYSQSGYTRQSVGGCGLWNKDANWANDSALPTINAAVRNGAAQSGVANVKILDIAGLLTGHRLCENTVGLLEEVGLSSWTQSGAADRTEWISQIRTVSTITPPYQLQEDSHTNYWGQLAMRNCLRQSFNGGAVRPGSCTATAGGGLNALGEPNVTLN
ncbi:MAG: hypothetical protein HYR62_01040 [Actinobacteria bacterium]|nr:hypothetical protein [Actinomycetota bacterium]MBI3686645.1 hypothetical protein [Actinomycetota bacterium]